MCLTASDGIEAQSLWSNNKDFPHLDFIFLDINMPKMNGLALLELIKQDKRFDDIPVYMLSTTSNKAEILHIRSLGATYVAKQNTFGEIINGLKSIFYPEQDLIELEGIPGR